VVEQDRHTLDVVISSKGQGAKINTQDP